MNIGTSLIARALNGKSRRVSSQVNFLFLAGENNSTCPEYSNSMHCKIDFAFQHIAIYK